MPEETLTKRYIDHMGAAVFVSCGISKGEKWMTVRQKSRNAGTHRVVTKKLPIRDGRQDAQRDLDAYAAEKCWKEIRRTDDSYFFIGEIDGLWLCQPLSLLLFTRLNHKVSANKVEIWTLADHALHVSAEIPGVSMIESLGAHQVLAKTVAGNTFFPLGFAYSDDENYSEFTIRAEAERQKLFPSANNPHLFMEFEKFAQAVLQKSSQA